MSVFSENLRLLRANIGLSQQKMADELIITRVRFAKYEEGKSEPPFDILKRISKYFHVSIDILINVELSKIPLNSLLKMEDNRILLPITVDKSGQDYIEILPYKAKAGYLSGYSDPEFIENLQQMHLPFLSKGKYRAFPIEGDSMPPHNEKSFIVGRYIEKLTDIKEGKTYVVLSKNDGVVYKRIFKKPRQQNIFLLHSDNAVYKTYEVQASEILEIWEHVCSFCTQEYQPDDLDAMNIKDILHQLRLEIQDLKKN
jgi:transcriptional regulator with XRE-family HTH domain